MIGIFFFIFIYACKVFLCDSLVKNVEFFTTTRFNKAYKQSCSAACIFRLLHQLNIYLSSTRDRRQLVKHLAELNLQMCTKYFVKIVSKNSLVGKHKKKARFKLKHILL